MDITFGAILAGIGAATILFALTFVSLVVGGLVNAMIVLTAGPIVDRLLGKRGAGPGSKAPAPTPARA